MKNIIIRMFTGFFLMFAIAAPFFYYDMSIINPITHILNSVMAAFLCTGMIMAFYGGTVLLARLSGADW